MESQIETNYGHGRDTYSRYIFDIELRVFNMGLGVGI